MLTVIPGNQRGFFSVFTTVLGALDALQAGEIDGALTVKLERGLYLDRRRGPDWWLYYFAPLMAGDARKGGSGTRVLNDTETADFARRGLRLSRECAHRLIAAHIAIKPKIHSIVRTFSERHFGTRPVVAVHYRGTDKIRSLSRADGRSNIAPSTDKSYRAVFDAVRSVLADYPNAVVFGASDETEFITAGEALSRRWKIPFVATRSQRSSRGGPGVHVSRRVRAFDAGLEALVDCLLLASARHLVRTSSNVSHCATYFAPRMPVTLIRQA